MIIKVLKKFCRCQTYDLTSSRYLLCSKIPFTLITHYSANDFLLATKSLIASISRRLVLTMSHFTLLYKCLVIFYSTILLRFCNAFIIRYSSKVWFNILFGVTCDLFMATKFCLDNTLLQFRLHKSESKI
jgi:hypothetical protein